MSERADLPCGCSWIWPGGPKRWYQVTACPDHVMVLEPCEEPEQVAR